MDTYYYHTLQLIKFKHKIFFYINYYLFHKIFYMYQISHSVIKSIWKVLSETELKFSSKLTSFCSQTWLFLLVCLGKCFSLEYPKKCCSI